MGEPEVFQIYTEKLCNDLRAEKVRRASSSFIAPREKSIDRVGVVTTAALCCAACGRPVEPDDFLRQLIAEQRARSAPAVTATCSRSNASATRPRNKMGGRKSREKGRRGELALVHLFQNFGFAAEKISRTGYTGSDISVPLLGRDLKCEVKVRGAGFRQLYAWLDGADFLTQ